MKNTAAVNQERSRWEELNEEQQRAVLASGDSLIIAGAGSGKSTLLCHRIAYLLLEEGVKPERILAVTFSRRAVQDIREKLEEVMDDRPALARRVHVYTFHAVMLRILRSARIKRKLLVEDWQKTKLLKPILRKHRLETDEGEELLSMLSLAKNKGIALHQLTIKNEEEEVMKSAMQAYEAVKEEGGWMDFDDLMQLCLERLATDQRLLELLQHSFDHVLLDEMQDTCRLQLRFLSFLTGNGRTFFACGDPRQSIYSFRGAEPRNLLDLQRLMHSPVTSQLTLNYRSGTPILRLANSLMEGHQAESLVAARTGGVEPHLLRPKDEKQEARELLSRIREETVPYADQCLLTRTTDSIRPVLELLVKAGIPLNVQGNLKILYTHPRIRPLIAHLRLCGERYDRQDLDLVMSTLYISPARYADYLNAQEHPSPASLLNCPHLHQQEKGRILDLLELHDQIRDMPPSQVVGEIRRFGYEAYAIRGLPMLSERRAVLLDKMDELEGAFQEYACLSTVLDFLDKLFAAVGKPNLQGLNLMTIHGAKGLEFTVVYLIGAVEGQLPHQKSLLPQQCLFPALYPSVEEALEEERRLAYVAVTRARDKLVISAPNEVKEREVELSRFFRGFFYAQKQGGEQT